MQCESRWGLLPAIMATLQRLHLDVIDHRSWHPPSKFISAVKIFLCTRLSIAKQIQYFVAGGADSTLVNEIYAKGSQTLESDEDFLASIQKTIFDLIKQSVSVMFLQTICKHFELLFHLKVFVRD